MGARTQGASLSLEACTIIAPSLEKLITQYTSHTGSAAVKPVRFTDCQIYLTEDDQMPNDMRFVNTRIQKIDPLSDDTLNAWIATQVTNARDGQTPDAEAMRQSLKLR